MSNLMVTAALAPLPATWQLPPPAMPQAPVMAPDSYAPTLVTAGGSVQGDARGGSVLDGWTIPQVTFSDGTGTDDAILTGWSIPMADFGSSTTGGSSTYAAGIPTVGYPGAVGLDGWAIPQVTFN